MRKETLRLYGRLPRQLLHHLDNIYQTQGLKMSSQRDLPAVWFTSRVVVLKIINEDASSDSGSSNGGININLSLECGDLLFACVNLVRHKGIDAENALRQANSKFEKRFRRLETLIAGENLKPEQMSLEELELIWKRVKSEES